MFACGVGTTVAFIQYLKHPTFRRSLEATSKLHRLLYSHLFICVICCTFMGYSQYSFVHDR
eukprot:UN06133